jgi:CheY-like chemotaxis protein
MSPPRTQSGTVTVASASPRRKTHRRTVLIVGDNSENRDVLQPILESIGCRVDIVKTGGRALEVLYERQPSLLLVDVNLEGRMPLSQFIMTIRTRYADLRVGLTGTDRAPQGIKADFILPQPLALDPVIDTFEKWLQSKKH